jgi:hypothetical protein
VIAIWRKCQGAMSLHVHCHISGDHMLLETFASLRFCIFKKELPLVSSNGLVTLTHTYMYTYIVYTHSLTNADLLSLSLSIYLSSILPMHIYIKESLYAPCLLMMENTFLGIGSVSACGSSPPDSLSRYTMYVIHIYCFRKQSGLLLFMCFVNRSVYCV